ncbi:hypothetical protein QQS45_08380 [Alteriqipengyuania flavescens]|uniref:hypothetical protein n=1 Tax=Alteriqipengyuania flavescens TaxID=3053610 RepID=UPI0025B28CAE|nr:hypothetical protein [Alteriqipengyuania flavescens]WJY17663.1 hypothetical protein QQW98_08375 [Alteriqipengyuania flavescens]WJY23606.1 hypothetical protein QQS45_08380 [Alteriqipengyuania flavescens]
MTILDYWLRRGLILFGLAATASCAGNPEPGMIQAPPEEPVIAEVIVPVPCEVRQVPEAPDPATRARRGDDIFTLAKIAAASRRVLLGDNEELRAANAGPCPEVSQ